MSHRASEATSQRPVEISRSVAPCVHAVLTLDGAGHLQARMEEQAECMLVFIRATSEGRKDLVGFQVGVRESARRWRELLVDVKRLGPSFAPEITVGAGALGFWQALGCRSPSSRR